MATSSSASSSHQSKMKSAPLYHSISPQSIKLMLDSHSAVDVNPEVLAPLASDVTYRVKELIHKAQQFMLHAKREDLTVDDLTHAMEVSREPAIFGHNSTGQTPRYVYVPEADLWTTQNDRLSLYTECSAELDLDEYNSQLDLEVSFEGEERNGPPILGVEERRVYSELATALLNKNPPIANYALQILRENSKISRVLVWVLKDMLKLTRETSSDLVLKRVQDVLDNVITNKHMKVHSHSLRDLILEILLSQIEEHRVSSTEIWHLKDRAVRLLCRFLQRQCLRNEELYQVITERMTKLIQSRHHHISAYYGPLVTLTHFGPHVQDTFLSLLPRLPDLTGDHVMSEASSHSSSATSSTSHLQAAENHSTARLYVREAVRAYLQRLLKIYVLDELDTGPEGMSIGCHPVVAQTSFAPTNPRLPGDVYAAYVACFGADYAHLVPLIQPVVALLERQQNQRSVSPRQSVNQSSSNDVRTVRSELELLIQGATLDTLYPSSSPPLLSACSEPPPMTPLRKISSGHSRGKMHGRAGSSKRRTVTMKSMGWTGRPIKRKSITFNVAHWTPQAVKIKSRFHGDDSDQQRVMSEFYTLFHRSKQYMRRRRDYSVLEDSDKGVVREKHFFLSLYSLPPL